MSDKKFEDKYARVKAQMTAAANGEISDIRIDGAVSSQDDIYGADDVEQVFDFKGESTGFPAIDKLIGGLRSRTCTILAADTGMGKSLLAIKILTNIAKRGVKVCYFDLENGKATSLPRIVGIWFGLKTTWFRDNANKKEMVDKAKELTNFAYFSHEKLYPLGFADQGYELVMKMIDKLAKSGVKVFLIDSLQNFEMMVSKREAKNIHDVIIKKLMEFAQERDVSILVCHHSRKSESGAGTWIKDIGDARKVMYKMPTLDDIKGSSGIVQTASDVWGLVRTKHASIERDQGNSILAVLKNRNGREGFVELYLDTSTLEFEESDPIKAFNGGLFDAK